MRDDQIVRIVAAIMMALGYSVRTVAIGNGTVVVLSYQAAPFALFLFAEITVALPEILNRIPIGSTPSS